MKKKSFMILLIFVVFSTIVIWLFNTPNRHSLSSFVSKTQLHIKNINSKFQVLDQDDSNKELEVESTYLELLGFVKDPNLFSENEKKLASKYYIEQDNSNELKQLTTPIQSTEDGDFNSELYKRGSIKYPPLVTAFSHFGEKENYLIESKMRYFLNDLILIYDLDLSSSENLKIKKKCNSSCVIKMFKTDKYPRHLKESRIKAYKPIIIQEVLNEYGSLIWVEPPNVFISNNIEKYLNKSRTTGLLAWPLEEPITQLTHPSMFKYFSGKQSDFYFVHMLDTSQLIIYNNWHIHSNLMLPWVKCALKADCIAPVGSQFSGCEFTRQPAFLYSGCHRYEMSAFSIITALLFDFDSSKYTMQLEEGNMSKPETGSNSTQILGGLQSQLNINNDEKSSKLSDLSNGMRHYADINNNNNNNYNNDIPTIGGTGSMTFLQKYYHNSFMTPIASLPKQSVNVNDHLFVSPDSERRKQARFKRTN